MELSAQVIAFLCVSDWQMFHLCALSKKIIIYYLEIHFPTKTVYKRQFIVLKAKQNLNAIFLLYINIFLYWFFIKKIIFETEKFQHP